ncbi:Cas6: CRISPR-associated endonuclease Cas6 [Desulfococcus multivorans]|nr:Cas6: CRISPR-associated endonuclease Cas6 [Desulfococcus multivorans]
MSLSGKSFEISGDNLKIGIFHSKALIPAVELYSHIVTTRNGHHGERFEEEIARQLSSIGVRGVFTFGKRKTFQVHGKQIVGYEMTVSELTAEESITLQENGLGGRRKMGCGFFEPRST